MISINRNIIITLLALMALTACGDKQPIEEIYTDFRLDIVTYAGHTDEGGIHSFDYYGPDNGEPTRLVYVGNLAPRIDGERVLLRYTTNDALAPGAVATLTSCMMTAIVSDTLRVTERQPGQLPADPVRLRSIWRTGPYLNVHCELEYTGETREFGLVADATTLASDTVTCRLVHGLMGAHPMQWRTCYASFWIGDCLSKPSCRVLRVIVPNDVIRPDKNVYCFDNQ